MVKQKRALMSDRIPIIASILILVAYSFYIITSEKVIISEEVPQKYPPITGFATLSLHPSPQEIPQGSKLRLDISATDVIDLAGVQIDVNYNPNVISYDKIVEGDFLNRENIQTLFLDTINTAQPGTIKDIAIVRLSGGVSGNGLIASVFFNAINTGVSDLRFGRILAADTNGNPITTNGINANVTVTPFSDNDNDGVADFRDRCPFTRSNISVNNYGCPIPILSKFSLELTTNFSDVDLTNFTGFKIGVQGLGQIDFGNNKIVLVDNVSGLLTPVNLDNVIDFLPNKVIVRSELFKQLNVSSTITLNIANVKNPRIMKDGVICKECKIVGFNNNTVTFAVSHHSEYLVEEGSYCGDNFCSGQESCSICSVDCGSCSGTFGSSGGSTSSGGGSGSGSSSGGSGGGRLGYVCSVDWKCDEWAACVDGFQTRKCEFAKIAQRWQETPCPDLSNQPSMRQACQEQQKPLNIEKQNKIKTEEKEQKQSNIELFLKLQPVSISGKSKKFLFAALLIIAIIGLIFLTILIFKLRKKKTDKSM